MIGVITNPPEEAAIREFFELFKTPWEQYRSGLDYEVVICVGNAKLEGISARLLIIYAAEKTSFDEERQVQIQSRHNGLTCSFAEGHLPIFGRAVTFRHPGISFMANEDSHESIGFVDQYGAQIFARIGYDLPSEVNTLLTEGQPSVNGSTPTLDLHIANLRDLIVGCGIPLVEIPPLPDRFPFTVCLTHDVDHPSIRRHRLDHTIFGFLLRATAGSLINLARGRISLSKVMLNWSAAVRLPFVYIGLAKDFWNNFERYLEIDGDHPSTFYFIPFSDRAGDTPDGPAPRLRAARYDISHVSEKIPLLLSESCEVGLHGIDAWADTARGREEARRITEVSGVEELGVRTHWLFRKSDSMRLLDAAGFLYDSSVGYSDAVGFRAGTNQVFKPLDANRMLEVPLHIMDTALFYSARMDLSPAKAWVTLTPIFEGAARHGGVVTIDWHDRSIAPERLWEDFYVCLLKSLEQKGPWFATVTQVVGWFQRRRSAKFECAERQDGAMRVRVIVPRGSGLPPMRLRVYKPARDTQRTTFDTNPNYSFSDYCLDSDAETCLPLHREGLASCQ